MLIMSWEKEKVQNHKHRITFPRSDILRHAKNSLTHEANYSTFLPGPYEATTLCSQQKPKFQPPNDPSQS
ncbi:hypothetical protein MPTK1_1g23550 [Marchantia polymorpha subsp. ruderalis]|uniref:Uncharacterized protein n=2 Tax=Marchantia polymorpha TaxID=3197 RepID=A0AAF6ATH9_MARPO|nr:hypothetical protein MARPO_0065s0022 [Marchantia polymorpha]BBM99749.1 hypothetical protein Mp_1g23550 [Marchantia polymorpha subsp. ruderalis]|eukprot:PTQ36206.1 hypothetical protein MARPO_0065s0022 [Marchantia polymorpha]